MGNKANNSKQRMSKEETRGAYLLDIVFNIVKKIASDSKKVTVYDRSIPKVDSASIELILKVLKPITGDDFEIGRHSHLQVNPPSPSPESDIRYFHVAELEDEYSMGIFFMPPGSKMPLHDHPFMCVFSRILVGSLKLTSFDWENPNDEPCTRYEPRKARLSQEIDLIAPHTLFLTPDMFNLHTIEAGKEGCAFLDILIPPYNDEVEARDCNYYSISNPSEKAAELFELVLCDPPTSFSIVHGSLNL